MFNLYIYFIHVCCFFSSGTIDDCELVEGLVLNQRVESSGVTRVEKAKIGLIQFCLSPPKTDVSHPRHTARGKDGQAASESFFTVFIMRVDFHLLK